MDQAIEAVGSKGTYQMILSSLVIISSPLAIILTISFPTMTSQPKFKCLDILNDVFITCSEEVFCKAKINERSIDLINSLFNISLEFELYCENGYLKSVIASSFFIGIISGTLTLSTIPDVFGREKIFKYLLVGNLIINISMVFCFSVYHFIAANFFSGVFAYIIVILPLFTSEFLNIDLNGIVLSLMAAANSTGGILITLFFIFVNNWRILFIILSCLNLLICILAFSYVIESPRWLFSQNRKRDSLMILQTICDINQQVSKFKTFMDHNPYLLLSNRTSLNCTRVDLYQINCLNLLNDEQIQKLNELKTIRRSSHKLITCDFLI